MDDTADYETELLKLNSEFSLIEYDARTIDQDGNHLDDEENEDPQNPVIAPRKQDGELREILNSLLPPIKVNHNEYKQVSLKKPTRSNVIALQRLWDEQLQIRQARETGICSIREELNEEAFNELIREITINLPERGLLSLRIRDEAKMTIETYQILYQSSLSFGMRKCIQSQSDILQLKEEIVDLKAKKADLAQKLKELQIEKQNHQKRHNEENQILQKKQNQEKEFLEHQRQALQGYLKSEFGK